MLFLLRDQHLKVDATCLWRMVDKILIEHFNSIDFHCIFCDNPDSLAKSIIEYMSPFSDFRTAITVTAFLICPQCRNKFFVKILDQGKIN